MSQTVLVWLVVGVAIAAVALRALLRSRPARERDPETAALDKQDFDLKEKYHNSIAAGERTRRLARVYSQVDLSMIKSLLDSKQIPNDLLFGNMNTLRTGVAVPGFNDSIVVVLERDYDAGRAVVEDYLGSLQRDPTSPKATTVLRNIAEVIVSETLVNPGAGRPELL